MSLRKAINQMCKSCIHDPLSEGTWRQQVFLCSVKSCPLWELRAKPTRPIPFTVITQYRAENDESQHKDGA